jgi:hypothetical protein
VNLKTLFSGVSRSRKEKHGFRMFESKVLMRMFEHDRESHRRKARLRRNFAICTLRQIRRARPNGGGGCWLGM